MLAKFILGLVAVSAGAFAQDPTIETSSASSIDATTTLSQAMPPAATASFNPAPVNSSVRFNWCRGQLNACPQICGGAAAQNFCDSDQLTYTCVCANGTAPDVTSFANTLPFYICQQTYIQCVANNPDDAQAQEVCTTNQQCGTRNATAEAIAQTMASESTTATSTSESSGSSETGSSTASETASSTSSDSAAVANVAQLSTGAFALLLAAAFKLFV
ncbi:uncharacterized protein HMPREF1541_06936 [Cyphellophora europaea CBS 101466]|uniref:DUF7707 domain-containing protein n=1 Tax=Cyphellophora europaea (strain CBS 101466) TaxID=1220924 RepID=W2RT68_CYPE1|nr:uncharacterized protein HMPREF1541_06936 [Cyphellophora europaea CBS 101466]ETN38894.1 hypothetical protein HMPREF1541_06936 [Cyphellophora europaea CBS 101466]